MMRLAWKSAAALAAALVIGACSMGGIGLTRSLFGELAPAPVLPETPIYLVDGLDLGSSWFGSETTMGGGFGSVGFSTLTLARQGDGYRIVQSDTIGVAQAIPSRQRRDTKYVYAVPNGFERFVVELSGRNDEGKPIFSAMFARRQCDGDACALGLMGRDFVTAADLEAAGLVIDERALHCSQDATSGMLMSCKSENTSAFAALVPEFERSDILSKISYDDYFLVYAAGTNAAP